MSGDHRDATSRRGEAAAGRPALQRHHLRREDDGGGDGGDPGLDGGPGEHRRAPSGAPGDAGGAARGVRPVRHAAAFRRPARDDRAWERRTSRTPTRRRWRRWKAVPLFTLTQARAADRLLRRRLNGGGGNQDRAKHTITKRAKRLRDRGEPYDRIWYRNRQDILYARTAGERQRWRAADRELVVAALERTEERVALVINAGAGDRAAFLKALRKPQSGEED